MVKEGSFVEILDVMGPEMDRSGKDTNECRVYPVGFLTEEQTLKENKSDITGYSNLKVNKFCLAAMGASLDSMDDNG